MGNLQSKINGALTTVVMLLLAIVGWFCVQTFSRMDRVEQKLNDLDNRVAALTQRFDDHFDKASGHRKGHHT